MAGDGGRTVLGLWSSASISAEKGGEGGGKDWSAPGAGGARLVKPSMDLSLGGNGGMKSQGGKVIVQENDHEDRREFCQKHCTRRRLDLTRFRGERERVGPLGQDGGREEESLRGFAGSRLVNHQEDLCFI